MSSDRISNENRVAPRPVETPRPAEKAAPPPPAAPAVQTDAFKGSQRTPSYAALGNPDSPGPIDDLRDLAMKGAKKLGGLWDSLVRKVKGTSPEDQAKMEEIEKFLANSPSGAAALQYLEDNDIPVEFADGGGSYWDGNKIVIDRSQDPQEAALTLVHEVNHARADRTGASGNVNKQTRDDYVNTMIEEEAVGTVASIEAKRELEAAGVQVNASFPLEAEYEAAYDAAVAEAKKNDPDATEAELDAIGRKAGLDRVRQGFVDGEVVTSTNGQTYPEYYGGYWDRVHGAGNNPAPSRPDPRDLH